MALPFPEYPIDHISIDTCHSYDTLCNRCETELRVAIAEEMNKTVFDALYAWGKAAGYIDDNDSPKPAKVIINDPATVVFFESGDKVVAKAKDGDEYDPLFGIMACALRKVGRNRVRIDAWEPVIGFLADYLVDARECRLMADMLTATADALELDGVMDAMDEWTIDEGEEPVPERDEDRIARYEMTRQRIRSLVDRGEL